METAPPNPAEEIAILRRMLAERDAVIAEHEATLTGRLDKLAQVRGRGAPGYDREAALPS